MFQNAQHSDMDLQYFYLCTGFAERDECCRDHRQTRTAFAASTQLVHPGNVRHERRRPLRRSRLVVEPAEESEIARLQELVTTANFEYHTTRTSVVNNSAVVIVLNAVYIFWSSHSAVCVCVLVFMCLWYLEPRYKVGHCDCFAVCSTVVLV